MGKDESTYFISGLKTVIKRSWPSQEEFAKGVTSRVNMSNILRLKSGTSQKMRKALADRAGMTVGEIITIGKGELPSSSVEMNQLETLFSADNLSGMTSVELTSAIGDYSLVSNESNTTFIRTMRVIISELADERNRTLGLLQKQLLISDSINQTIAVFNRDLNTTYCNEPYREFLSQNNSDKTSDSDYFSHKKKCLSQKVFLTGNHQQNLFEVKGHWFYQNAYPVSLSRGKVSEVIIVTQKIDDLLDMLTNNGWKFKKKKKS